MWDEIAEMLDEDEQRAALMWDEVERRQAEDTARYERYMMGHDAAHADYRLVDEGDN
jgi:uncharacterized small protein (DUF1192 family)